VIGTTTITITPVTGTRVNGVYTRTSGTSYTVRAQVEDVDARTAEALPEGARERCRKVANVRGTALTVKPISLSSGHPGDLVTYRSKTYHVLAVADFQDHVTGLPHIEIYMAEAGSDE